MDYTYEQIAKMIDHSLLNPTLKDGELEEGCRIALQYNVASVCIKPYYLRRCAELLAGSTVAPSTVIGFPHGGNATAVKLAETEQALADGGIAKYDWFPMIRGRLVTVNGQAVCPSAAVPSRRGWAGSLTS